MIRAKRLLCLVLLFALLAGPVALATTVSETEAPAEEAALEVEESSIYTTYLAAVLAAVRDGSPEALAEAEAVWTRQVEELETAEVDFFETEETPYALAVAIADYLIEMGVTELDGEPLQLRIVASSLNLREGPEREYERIGSFKHGTIVTFLGSNEDGWLHITDGELVGWVSALHLAPFDGTPTPTWSDVPPGSVGSGTPAGTNTDASDHNSNAGNSGSNNNASASGNSSNTGGNGSAGTAPAANHSQDDLFWLALTIQIEAGSNWLCDKHQRLVGEVVLNRVAHPRFPPTTIHGVVHQPGQYPWAARGVRVAISDRAWANAQWLLNGNRVANNPNLVFQAQFPQGSSTFTTIHCSILNTTTYFGIL